MSVNIYIDSCAGNYIGAVADGEKLLEYRMERKNQTVAIGSIYKGRVENVLVGMQAAFINVGLDKNGYLSMDDMLMDRSELAGVVEFKPVSDLKVGEEIMVQAVKDPAGSKGVRLTTNISFAGRYVVYMPTIDFKGVSRKITDEKDRERLYGYAEEFKPTGGGIILRTAAVEAKKSEIGKEIEYLQKKFETIKVLYENCTAPYCVHEEGNLAFRLIRDVFSPNIDKVIVGDKEIYEKIKEYASKADKKLKSKLHLYTKNIDMFRNYGLEADVETLIDEKIYLDSGAYLVIDKTEALTVIDVNTGGFVGKDSLEETVFETNVLAAEEIARQLRLRNISGIIVVDFIDMAEEEHKRKLLEVLNAALDKDRERCNVVGMTGLGLVEITRKKRRRESVSMMVKPCPYCQGTGQIQSNDYTVMKIRTALLDLFSDGYDNAILDLNAELADYVLAKKVLKKDIENVFKGKRIYIIPHKTYHQHFFLVKGDNNKAMIVPDKAILLY